MRRVTARKRERGNRKIHLNLKLWLTATEQSLDREKLTHTI